MQFHYEVAFKTNNMKNSLMHFFGALFVLSLIFFTTCTTDEPKPGGEWSEENKESYDQVLNTQDQVGEDLDDWFQTMDSLDAINKAYQAFVNSENVSSATINSQGIAVQYSNGIRGGLFLRPKDDAGEVGKEPLFDVPRPANGNGLKSLVNKRKMIFINPHYYERSYFSDQMIQMHANNLVHVGMNPLYFYKNDSATVDHFANLEGYGIIQVYSHGWAWPKENNITEVYLLTGETANESTSKKYWDDLTGGNIPIVKIAGNRNKYLISPAFIEKYNDFSKDNVLFYGGFCYSFLGGWPDLVHSFADGVYLGFDWSVYTFRNANWSVNMIAQMSDTSKPAPVTIGEWIDNSELEKSYWNERDQRTVHIYYTGDEKLTLWGDTKVKLIALSSDGTPVSNPGEVGVAYSFKCEVVSDISELEYVWDIGTGDPPYTLSNAVNITWSEEGKYVLKVDVRNKNNGNIIGTAKVDVTIGDSGEEELIDILKMQNHVYLGFGPQTAFIWDTISSPVTKRDYGDLEWDTMPIVWDGDNFSGTVKTYDGMETHFVNGTVSSDGSTVSVVAEQEGYSGGADFTFKLTIGNYPVELPLGSSGVMYRVESNQIQNYVTGFEGRWYWSANGHVVNYTGVKWEEIESLYINFVWGAGAPKPACVDM
jgi:hypothetical protein